jgi:hypothetical protein
MLLRFCERALTLVERLILTCSHPRMKRFRALFLLAFALPLLGQDVPATVQRSFDAFRAEAVRAHLKFLASDLLEGRGPGTRGDALATSYIASQFEAMGLQPAGDNGTYFQKVSLLGITTDETKSTVSFRKGAVDLGALKYRDQFVGGNQSQQESVSFDSEVVFVGHGVAALQEAGVLHFTPTHFISLPLLGVHPSVQGLASQGLVVLLVVAGIAANRRMARRAS